MKNKDLKKGRESIIGKIIYGFLLFMPLLAITTTCLYAIFNKNAYKSYASNQNQQYELTQIDVENLTPNNTYLFKSTSITNPGLTNIGVLDLTSSNVYINGVNYALATTLRFYPVNNSNSFYIQVKDANTNNLYSADLYTTPTLIQFNYIARNSNYYLSLLNDYFFYESLNETSLISNAFYYSVDKVTESPLFNWAENSLIYTGIENTCTQLAITTPFIPLLLAYWLIISVIYILYDIILMILIILHNKIHQIQDSI